MAWAEKYVTDAAAGGGDGSVGTPWTLAEALTSAVAGNRVNVQSDGAYSLGADVFTNAGTSLDLILFRGYNSTIGDLDGQGRNSDGTLNTTNFPAITLTGGLTPNAFCFIQNLAITGAISDDLIGSTTIDSFGIISCELVNTQSNANAQAVQGDNNWIIIDSDLECSGATHGIVADLDLVARVNSSRFKSVANDGLVAFSGEVIGNVFIGNAVGAAFNHFSRTNGTITVRGNTMYNWATAVELGNSLAATTPIILNNHVTDCAKYIDDLYVATDSTPLIEMNNRTRDNTTPRTGVGDGFNVSEVTTDTGGIETDYTNAGADDLSLIAAAPGVDTGLGFG